MSPGSQRPAKSSSTALSPPNRPGPPVARSLTKKRPHRRSPQACDECRLRKRACDAVEPCSPCQRAGLNCTYQFRRPVPPPTLRIRNLQDHLSLARNWLQHVKENVADIPGLDLDECLRTLDFTQPNLSDATSPTTNNEPTLGPRSLPSSTASTPAKLSVDQASEPLLPSDRQNAGNMLAGCDRAVTLPSGESCFYGAFSDFSFALRTIELFREGPHPKGLGKFDHIRSAFAKPFPRKGEVESRLPLPDDILDTLGQGLNVPHLMLSPLPIRRVTNVEPQTLHEEDSVPLLHVSLALTLTNLQEHQSMGCRVLTERAHSHFSQGLSSLLPVDRDSLMVLQALLCAVNFMLSSSRITAAHSLVAAASSLARRLGLVGSKKFSDSARRTEKVQISASLMTLDMLISLILDIPCSLPRNAIDETEVVELAQEFESGRDFRTAAMLRQVSLLLVPITIRDRSRRGTGTSSEGGSDAVMEDIRLLETAHAGFRRWKRDASPLLTSLGPADHERIVRKDLEMLFSFCQLVVFRSHLHHLRSVAVGGSMSKAQSYHALACLKIATSTIGHVDRPTDSTQLHTLAGSWLGIYTIFTAVMCLVFLIAAHPGTARPSVAWQRAHRGIRILASCACGDNIAAACLEVVKIVTTELSHTVYFDYHEIENTVRRICDGDQARDQLVQQSPLGAPGMDSINNFMDNPADRMLFQADTLTSNFDFGDILHLSDTE